MWNYYWKGTKYLWVVFFFCSVTTICGAVELTEEDKKHFASDLAEMFKPFIVQSKTLPETGQPSPQMWGVPDVGRWTVEGLKRVIEEVVTGIEQMRREYAVKGVTVKGFSVSGPIPSLTVNIEFE